MSDALLATNRSILYSICTARYGLFQPLWSRRISNSWRTTTDINSGWDVILRNLDGNNQWWSFAGASGWNDPDMIQVGNGQLTDDEQVSHFSLWCIIKAPLIIGTPLSTITDRSVQILTNTELIAINQDKLGRQAHLIVNVSGTGAQIWSGPLNDGTIVAVLFNRGDTTTDITLHWRDVDITVGANATVRDLWQHADIGTFDSSFTAKSVRRHASVSIKITVHAPLKCCLPPNEL